VIGDGLLLVQVQHAVQLYKRLTITTCCLVVLLACQKLVLSQLDPGSHVMLHASFHQSQSGFCEGLGASVCYQTEEDTTSSA
jgi:hypothetical protein